MKGAKNNFKAFEPPITAKTKAERVNNTEIKNKLGNKLS